MSALSYQTNPSYEQQAKHLISGYWNGIYKNDISSIKGLLDPDIGVTVLNLDDTPKLILTSRDQLLNMAAKISAVIVRVIESYREYDYQKDYIQVNFKHILVIKKDKDSPETTMSTEGYQKWTTNKTDDVSKMVLTSLIVKEIPQGRKAVSKEDAELKKEAV